PKSPPSPAIPPTTRESTTANNADSPQEPFHQPTLRKATQPPPTQKSPKSPAGTTMPAANHPETHTPGITTSLPSAGSCENPGKSPGTSDIAKTTRTAGTPPSAYKSIAPPASPRPAHHYHGLHPLRSNGEARATPPNRQSRSRQY